MSMWFMEVKGMKGGFLLLTLVYLLLLLLSILRADPRLPPDPFVYHEASFLPFLIMFTITLFQREFGSGTMEIIATFPHSFAGMLLRKGAIILIFAALYHRLWVWDYLMKFSELNAVIYDVGQGKLIVGRVAWPIFFLQALPAYLLMMSLTMLGILLVKRLYGGMLFGFLLWATDILSQGKILQSVTLHIPFIPDRTPFLLNRILLLVLAILIYISAILLVNRRSRYILDEEME